MSTEFSVKIENASLADISASDLLMSLDTVGRLGVQWLRYHVGKENGVPAGYTKAEARAATLDQVRSGLETVCRGLCRAAIGKTGIAHETGFDSLRVHLKNAFPHAISGVTARTGTKAIKRTKQYETAPVWVAESMQGIARRDGEIATFHAALGIKEKTVKETRDAADPTKDVLDAPGSDFAAREPLPDLPDGIERVDMGGDTRPECETHGKASGIRYTPEAVALANRQGFADGRKAVDKAMRRKARAYYLALSEAQGTIERQTREIAALKARLAAVEATPKAKARAKA
jgi:hypothetical protein